MQFLTVTVADRSTIAKTQTDLGPQVSQCGDEVDQQ
jgi:hypothetical protein